jgi:hypothetical protein
VTVAWSLLSTFRCSYEKVIPTLTATRPYTSSGHLKLCAISATFTEKICKVCWTWTKSSGLRSVKNMGGIEAAQNGPDQNVDMQQASSKVPDQSR